MSKQQDYRMLFALEHLQYRPLSIADPVPTGRQIMDIAGLKPPEEHSLFAILPSGDFEDVRPNETFDLREKGAERFIAFKADQFFKFTLDGHQITWGGAIIDAADLYLLADVDDETAVFQEVRGGEDILIEPNGKVDLSNTGVERFITAPKPTKGYVIILNSREYTLPEPLATYEQIVALEFEYPPSNPNITYTMTYRHAQSKPHAGELAVGGSVTVKKKGTVFNVTATDKS
jgi:hypothetical protein